MGEPITKQQREAMREDAASARHAFCRDDVLRLLDALEAAEAETERMREAAQVAEADAQRLTAELALLRGADARGPRRGAVERPDDMTTKGKLRVFIEDDGDAIVAVHAEERGEDGEPMTGPGVNVQFCAPFTGGGHSPETWRALCDLAKAMQRDVERDGRGRIV